MQKLHRQLWVIIFAVSLVGIVKGQIQWQYRNPMPTARQGMAVAALGDSIYVIGGTQAGHNALNVVEMFQASSNTWISGLPPINFARTNSAAVAFQGKLYLFGGRNHNNIISAVEMYDPGSNQWVVVSQLPTPREGLSAVVVDSVIWVIGGASAQVNYDIVEIYDPQNNSWSTLPEHLLVPRVASVAAVINNMIYVFGGFYFGPLDSYERYVPGQGWEMVGSMLYSCGSSGGDVYNGQIWIVGGENSSGILDNVQYNDILHQGNWENGPPLQTPRKNLAVVQVENTLYAIGGKTTNHMGDATNVVEALDLLTDITSPENTNLPRQLLVKGAYPNPFNGTTTIEIYQPHAGAIQIEVLNILGQRVRQLYHGIFQGWKHIRFDGLDDNGNHLPSGIYFVYVHTAAEQEMIKINYIK
ncbi:MAG: T9SS C-terminal target domain-containing protein [Calditrichaeota bacterium]|nr:MAG: T9SS C-terminal target domain-containing protein [Calditrichota bacterium]